jgi:hypothetical protein
MHPEVQPAALAELPGGTQGVRNQKYRLMMRRYLFHCFELSGRLSETAVMIHFYGLANSPM